MGASGERREKVEVLRGDPEEVQAVVDSLEFEQRSTAPLLGGHNQLPSFALPKYLNAIHPINTR